MNAAACVRTTRGRLDVARAERGAWVTACGRKVRGRDLVIHQGRHAAWRAWRLELTCTDCERLLSAGPAGFRRATGW